MPAGGSRRLDEPLALAALLLLVFALNVTPITNNDLFLHLKTGAVVLSTGQVPRLDDYSALARGRPFIAHEWLAGVLFRLVELSCGGPGGAGLDALILLKAGVASLVALALYAAARWLGASPAAALPGLAFVMVLAAARFLERPHIFSYLMTAAFLLLLARRRAGARAPLWAFLPLQAAWANLHGGFVLGPALVGLAATGAAIDAALPPAPRERLREAARLAGLAPLLVGACLLNPYGVALLRFPFALTGSAFMEAIYEWLPPFGSAFSGTYMFREYVAWIVVGGAAFLAAGAVALRRRQTPPWGTFPPLVFLFFLALSLRMNRNVTDFALATLPGVAAAATFILPRRGAAPPPGPTPRPGPGLRPLPFIALALVGLSCWFAAQGYAYSPSGRRPFGLGLGPTVPVAGADYLERNGVRGNAFNNYSSGAYLVYRFHPAVRVAMDSRNDVYGEELYREYNRALGDRQALAAMLRRIDAAFVFLEWSRPGPKASVLLKDLGGWRPVYFDDQTVIYLPEGRGWDALIARDGYQLLEPSLFLAGGLAPGQAPLALQEAERAVRDSHGAYVARVMRIEALAKAGRRREAFADEAAILAERPALQHIYVYLGMIRLGLGDRREAADRFRLALAMNPASEAARWGLQRATAPPAAAPGPPP